MYIRIQYNKSNNSNGVGKIYNNIFFTTHTHTQNSVHELNFHVNFLTKFQSIRTAILHLYFPTLTFLICYITEEVHFFILNFLWMQVFFAVHLYTFLNIILLKMYALIYYCILNFLYVHVWSYLSWRNVLPSKH